MKVQRDPATGKVNRTAGKALSDSDPTCCCNHNPNDIWELFYCYDFVVTPTYTEPKVATGITLSDADLPTPGPMSSGITYQGKCYAILDRVTFPGTHIASAVTWNDGCFDAACRLCRWCEQDQTTGNDSSPTSITATFAGIQICTNGCTLCWDHAGSLLLHTVNQATWGGSFSVPWDAFYLDNCCHWFGVFDSTTLDVDRWNDCVHTCGKFNKINVLITRCTDTDADGNDVFVWGVEATAIYDLVDCQGCAIPLFSGGVVTSIRKCIGATMSNDYVKDCTNTLGTAYLPAQEAGGGSVVISF